MLSPGIPGRAELEAECGVQAEVARVGQPCGASGEDPRAEGSPNPRAGAVRQDHPSAGPPA